VRFFKRWLNVDEVKDQMHKLAGLLRQLWSERLMDSVYINVLADFPATMNIIFIHYSPLISFNNPFAKLTIWQVKKKKKNEGLRCGSLRNIPLTELSPSYQTSRLFLNDPKLKF